MHGFKLFAEVFHPAGTLTDAMSKSVIEGTVCQCVSEQMDGTGYAGEDLCTNMQNVSVMLRTWDPDLIESTFCGYLPEDVSLGFTFLVRIAGYDYPNRMLDMEDRLNAIARVMEKALGRLNPPIDVETLRPYDRVITPALVAVMFAPFHKGYLVTSKK